MGDRIALMHEGALVQVDTPEGIYRAPDGSVRGALLLRAERDRRNRARTAWRKPRSDDLPHPVWPRGRPAIVGIRPQALRHPSAGRGRSRARLQHRQFLGHVDLMEVAVEGLERPLKGRILRDAIPAVNADIGVEFDPAEVLVFAASEA